jgi:hypothetical protein
VGSVAGVQPLGVGVPGERHDLGSGVRVGGLLRQNAQEERVELLGERLGVVQIARVPGRGDHGVLGERLAPCPRRGSAGDVPDPVGLPVDEQGRHGQPVVPVGPQGGREQRGENVDHLGVGPVRVRLQGVRLHLRVGRRGLGGLPGEAVPGEQGLHPQCRHACGDLHRVPRRAVARRVGHHQCLHAGGIPAHDLLRDVASEAQPHEHEALARKVLQQRLDVGHGRGEREFAGGFTVGPQVRGDDGEAVLQSRNLRVPAAMVEGGAVQQHDRGLRELRGGAADPVAEDGVGPGELVG